MHFFFLVEFNFLLKTVGQPIAPSSTPLSFVSSWGHNPSKWPTPIHLRGGSAKSSTPVARNLGLPLCPQLLSYPLAADGPESYFRCPQAQCPIFCPPASAYISMLSAHCICPAAVTNQREKHGQKAGLKRREIWHLYFWHEREEWIRLIS